MLGKCFSFICIISTVFALLTSNLSSITTALIDGANKSVNLVISLIGITAFWSGVINVLKDAGIIKKISRLLRPILVHIFPTSFKNDIATEEITACISSNVLGISNAATPLAINAIKKMHKASHSSSATADMITLAVLGCCCFNLVPTTIIAIRSSLGAKITYEIIVPVWISSLLCCVIGVTLSCLIGRFKNGKG